MTKPEFIDRVADQKDPSKGSAPEAVEAVPGGDVSAWGAGEAGYL